MKETKYAAWQDAGKLGICSGKPCCREEEKSGKCFDEAYDMKTIEPVPEWQQMQEEAVEDLLTMGLDL